VRQDGYCTGTVTPLPPAQAAPRDPMHHEPIITQDNGQ